MQHPDRSRSNRLPIILGSVSGALGLFVICLTGWFVYTRHRRRKKRRASQMNWDYFYEWKDRYSSGSIIKVEELGEETLEEGKTPYWPPEGKQRRPISARFSSLRRSISRRSSRKPSPRRKSAVSAGGIDNDTSATNLVVAAPPAPLPLYYPPGIQNNPSSQEPSVPQYHHPHQPLFASNTSYAESSPVIHRP